MNSQIERAVHKLIGLTSSNNLKWKKGNSKRFGREETDVINDWIFVTNLYGRELAIYRKELVRFNHYTQVSEYHYKAFLELTEPKWIFPDLPIIRKLYDAVLYQTPFLKKFLDDLDEFAVEN